MKILLLNPPTFNDEKFIREGRCTQEQDVWATLWPPLSLAMIAALLRTEKKNTVCIIDCPAQNMGMKPLLKNICRPFFLL